MLDSQSVFANIQAASPNLQFEIESRVHFHLQKLRMPSGRTLFTAGHLIKQGKVEDEFFLTTLIKYQFCTQVFGRLLATT